MEKGMRGLCSESVFSSSLKIGFALIARRVLLHSQTSQTNWVLWGMVSLAFFNFLTGGAEFMFQG